VDLEKGDGVGACSVLIVTAPANRAALDTLAQFLRHGGGVLAAAAHVAGLGGTTVRKEQLAYLVSDGDAVFPSVRLVDLGVEGQLPREAHHLRTPDNMHAVFAGALAGGVAVLLPFDPVHVLHDVRTADRAFHARHDRLPTERVSRVSRGGIASLIHDSLTFLHHARSMPYVHLWYYPGTRRNALAFRIDTDGAGRKDIDGLYSVLRTASVPATWFLDVAAHEAWLGHFRTFEGHEIGLHCYRHRIHGAMSDQEADWRHGLALIRDAGYSPAGMAAPYGAWTPALGEVIDRLGLTYSSEFSYAYDTVPIMPLLPSATVRTLQVPIHPVSTGSLRRAGFSLTHMKEYFIAAADALLARGLPLFFYHHPTQHAPGVFEALFEHVRAQGVTPIRMDAMARWWLGRAAVKADLRIEGDTLEVGSDADLRAADVAVRVALPSGDEGLVAARSRIDLRTVAVSPRAPLMVPRDCRATREFDPRRAFSDLFISLLRRLV
jgi:hypothetical protein